ALVRAQTDLRVTRYGSGSSRPASGVTTTLMSKTTLFPYTTLFRSPAKNYYRKDAALGYLSEPGTFKITLPGPYSFRITHSQNGLDRKSTRLNSSHLVISYAVFCLKKKIHAHPHRSSTAARRS